MRCSSWRGDGKFLAALVSFELHRHPLQMIKVLAPAQSDNRKSNTLHLSGEAVAQHVQRGGEKAAAAAHPVRGQAAQRCAHGRRRRGQMFALLESKVYIERDADGRVGRGGGAAACRSRDQSRHMAWLSDAAALAKFKGFVRRTLHWNQAQHKKQLCGNNRSCRPLHRRARCTWRRRPSSTASHQDVEL